VTNSKMARMIRDNERLSSENCAFKTQTYKCEMEKMKDSVTNADRLEMENYWSWKNPKGITPRGIRLIQLNEHSSTQIDEHKRNE